MDPIIARKTWRTPEPIHTLVYFAPEAREEYAAIGVSDVRAGYFGSRSAPLGPVPPEVVIATFFNFQPQLVRAGLETAWATTTPEAILAARTRAADRALRRLLGEAVDSAEMKEAATLAEQAALTACEHLEGRPLFAAHAALPWPDGGAHMTLWHAQTLLREFRGDGHIGALVAEGVTNIEALVLHTATGELTPNALQGSRAWPAGEWAKAVEQLTDRGMIAAADPFALTDAGRAHREGIEDRTDRAALPAYEPLGEDGCTRLRALARPFSRAIVDSTSFDQSPLMRPAQ